MTKEQKAAEFSAKGPSIGDELERVCRKSSYDDFVAGYDEGFKARGKLSEEEALKVQICREVCVTHSHVDNVIRQLLEVITRLTSPSRAEESK